MIEFIYQSDSNNTIFIAESPSGNIPATPSIVLLISQVR